MRDGCARGRLAAMGCESYQAAREGGGDLFPLRQLRRCGICQKSRDWNAHERVRGVPKQIENRNFIPDEFQQEQCAADRDDFPIPQCVQRGR